MPRGRRQNFVPLSLGMATYDREAQEARETRARELAAWKAIESNIKIKRFDRAPWVPKSFDQFSAHSRELKYLLSQERDDRQLVKDRDAKMLEKIGGRPVGTWHGYNERDGALGVLGDPTIWGSNWTSESVMSLMEPPGAGWPSKKEYEEEGDERHTSGFGRFLPPPRVIANDTVNWKQCPFLPAYQMDHACPAPRKYGTLPLPGDVASREPDYDENGIPIDDHADYGRVKLANPNAVPSRIIRSDRPWNPADFAPEACVLPPGKSLHPTHGGIRAGVGRSHADGNVRARNPGLP